MRKDFGPKTWIYPMPVLILAAYGEDGSPMAMNVGWAGIGGNQTIVIGLTSDHQTTENLLHSRAFTVSPATLEKMAPCDYVGTVSGRDNPNKMEIAGFHCHRAEFVNAPVIEELPMTVECEMTSYDPVSEILMGRILNVSADESILNEKGRIDAEKAGFLTLDPCRLRYRTLGPIVGQAYKEGEILK